MKKRKNMLLITVLAVAGAMAASGCRDAYPHSFVWQPGDVQRSHGEPAEGGYYTNWDPYAAKVEVTPVSDVNPVRTQHVLVATVTDCAGTALPNRRVEWMIMDDSVGAFAEVDESGWRASRGHKVDNHFAITHTNNGPHILTRGNSDPDDDVHLMTGQTWVVITSAIEGTTNVVAYVPGIHNWDDHKVFVTKHWYDVAWKLPPEATNRVGTDHALTTMVMKHSDSTPLEGYLVTYKILGGPPAMLEPGGGQMASTKTNAQGMATVTLKQRSPVEGTNDIEVHIVRPENKVCCKPAADIYTGTTKKTWLAPDIAITKTAPARAMVGEMFRYNITVTNPGKVSAENVVLTDRLPDGIEHVSSTPQASVNGQQLSWRLGTLSAGGTQAATITVKGTRTGTFENCVEVKADEGLAARSCASTLIVQAKLALTKTGPAEVILCDDIVYTLKVTNTGDGPATNVRVEDQLPEGMATTDGRNAVAFAVASLAPGESRTATVTARASGTGSYLNKAMANADGGLSADATARTLVRKPVLEVTKEGPAKRYIGRPATYTITVRNTGDAPAMNTVLTDSLPPGMDMGGASDGGQMGNGMVQWNLGTIPVDGSRKVSITLTPTRLGAFTNRVHAKGHCCEASAEHTLTAIGIAAILLEAVDTQDPIELGANETYIITVTNQGSSVGTNIKVVCTFAPEMEYVSATGPVEATVEGRDVVFGALPSLAPKAQATYRVVGKGIGAGDLRFRVTLTSDQMTTPATETESTHIYE